jgi:glycerate 2-kinase
VLLRPTRLCGLWPPTAIDDRRGVFVRVLICPDKFKGTASAAAVAGAMALAIERRGWEAELMPMADGGEGTLEVLGGANRTTTVTGPLGTPVDARWRLDGDLAVIEAAECAGLVLAGGPDRNRPLDATTRGVGELLAHALSAGARRVLVTVGGVATTDGGLPLLDVVGELPDAVDLQVACDVTTRFTDAARVFGPQKGASPSDVEILTHRLSQLRTRYLANTGRDVQAMPGSGAAGGLAGGLAALGARLLPGVDMVADAHGIDAAINDADLVLTGEGRLDQQSFEGKVVGGIAARAERTGVPCAAIVGITDLADPPIPVASLVDACGPDRALRRTTESIMLVTDQVLDGASLTGLSAS